MRTALRMLTALSLLATVVSASATTIVVDWGGGTNFEVIQDALDVASPGDTVLVMPGTYSGTGNYSLDFGGTNCVLLAGGGARSVAIDCGGNGRAITFQNGEGPDCVVDGFTITNGSQAFGGAMYFIDCSPTIRNCVMTENSADSNGGAVICAQLAHPVFEDCTFSSNTAQWGAAVYLENHSDPTFNGCTFSDNTADWGGGGVWMSESDSFFDDCDFSGNTVTAELNSGGGMYIRTVSSPTVTNCRFTGNGAPSEGGAVHVFDYSNPSFTDCRFVSNYAKRGAAVVVYEEITPGFDSCVFYYNAATQEGGAVYVYDSAAPEFDACTFALNTAGNEGGAAYIADYGTAATLTGCTLYANSAPSGSGVWNDYGFAMENCIVAFGVGGEAVYCDGEAPTISCTNVYGNAGGDWVGCLAGMDLLHNNLDEDPLFCDAANLDFTLDAASPCTGPNAPSCGLIGAWDIGCDTPVRAESWGAMKAMYK